MPITHRFISDLENLEQKKIFCDNKVDGHYSLLIIGTFNPDTASCEKSNSARWFYGRKQSKFWRYVPKALGDQSLHVSDRPNAAPELWKKYCEDKRIIIIDLVKRINVVDILPDFGDRKVECKINHDLSNTDYFNISSAFSGITFEKVIYSLKWSDGLVVRLRSIRDIVNADLLSNGCINNVSQIKYCATPSRNDGFDSWNEAINGL